MSQLLTIDEVAKILSLSKSTLYKWVSARKIPHVKIGQEVRFDQQKIENWIKNRTVNEQFS